MTTVSDIVRLTQDDYDLLGGDLCQNTIYMIQEESMTLIDIDGGVEETQAFFRDIESNFGDLGVGEYHIKFKIKEETSLGFRNWDGTVPDIVTFKWSDDNGVTWHSEENLSNRADFISPGEYLIFFDRFWYKCIFGNDNDTLAGAFTEIYFGDTYEIKDSSELFKNCTSLESTNFFPGISIPQTLITHSSWSYSREYAVGDIVIIDDIMYVANRHSAGIRPNINQDGWTLIKTAEDEPWTIKENTEKVNIFDEKLKENMAGISTEEIPS